MKQLTLQEAAKRLGLTRPKLIQRMQAAGLLNDKKLPARPVRDGAHLITKDGSWYHPELGMQYSQSTRIRAGSLPWLSLQLGLTELPEPQADPRDVA